MELQISYRICTEIQKADHLWKNQGRDRENTANAVRKERGGDNKGRSVRGPYPYAGQYSAEV